VAQATALWKTQPLTVTHVAGGYRDWGLAPLVRYEEVRAPTKLVANGFIDIEASNQYTANVGRLETRALLSTNVARNVN
jgi:hypothetical protein